MRLRIASIAFATLWLAVSVVAQAQSGNAETTSAYGDFPPAPLQPGEIVTLGVQRLSAFLSATDPPSAGDIRAFLDREIASDFDFAYMTKWAVGPYYRRMRPEQRSAVASHLTNTFLTALARNLGSFATPAPDIEVLPASQGRTKSEVAVLAHVTLNSSSIIALEFRFYWSPEGWKIFDVAANGTSAVGYYRRYYTETLRRRGPDAFIE